MLNANKHSLRSVVRKIFAAFLLVSLAIFLALTIARFSFKELMNTVDELSEPNEKLILLNTVFEEVTTLDQLQRAEAIRNPNKPYDIFLEQSASLYTLIDSLKTLPWDTAQLKRLDEMKSVLQQRNELFFSYLKVKADLLENREFSTQIDTLEAILEKDGLALDSTFLTQETRTTTTYIQDTTRQSAQTEDRRSFLKRLFSKRKEIAESPDTPRVRIETETSLAVDSAAMARQDRALAQIERIMREMERDQHSQRKQLQQQELELIHANSLFINQLLNILHHVEKEELASVNEKNEHAVGVIAQSLSRINILMLSFFLAAALLVYLIWIDIGKSNYYKEQLETARDEAEELSKIKQRFLANMSHEIRTPLQSIIGFAEQLKRREGETEEVRAIYSSSEHLLHIVNEVLDYSRISSGTFKLASEKFRPLQVVREVEAAMRVQAERKSLTFLLDTEQATAHHLMGDPFRLRQILYNLLGNAIKFTHQGFVKLSVRTVDEDETVRCIFEVIDTGIGMRQEDLDRIFNQFEQIETATTKQYGGTGLGLTIVKALIDAQEGALDVSSEPAVGTSFRVELTFRKAGTEAPGRVHYDRRVTPAKQEGLVLAVDDDPLILRLASMILSRQGIPFEVFGSARAALAYQANQPVSSIFLDIRMPEMNGIELCGKLRKRYGDKTRFIALTAHVLPEERESLFRHGFDAILPKPFHEHELLTLVEAPVPDNAPLPEPEEQPDLSGLRRMTMGDEALFHAIVGDLLNETREDLERVDEHLEHFRTDALREVVHKMAGRFGQIGMLSLGVRLQSIEKKLVAGQTHSELLPEITTTMDRVRSTLAKIRLMEHEHLN